ncbi:MAG: dTDP-glucose 4,6-dehydratase [Anaerolineaceae bacterium 4572_78]|nr:MAG: dTDP-glucose 4,6-dehydratase [Anaerolineaceae bacterium 4572_78]
MKNILVTGGAGFIGSNFVHMMLDTYDDIEVIVYDKLTYAGNLDNLIPVADNPHYTFYKGDICHANNVDEVMKKHKIDTIVNFAAETHVDRSLMEPGGFIQTDVYGTYVLLEAAKKHGVERMNQVSTDEVYGQVLEGRSKENDRLHTRSPYSASKAGGDLMCQAYYTSFNVPVTITRGSNNIGQYQYPEKVVPLFISNALEDKPLPVYGDGLQMRDYQYVLDHCRGIDMVLRKGMHGEIYNIGSGMETTNIVMTKAILHLLNKPESLIQYITDRPGHDRRYALDVSKAQALGWKNEYDFERAIAATVKWYVENQDWWRKVKEKKDYQEYYQRNYAGRDIKNDKI